jgi:peptidoglycan/xylan/chitin deacetylase (PgdA/CDA1 family)
MTLPPDQATLAVVWDFDSATGQVNATFPYHFRRAPLDEELAAVRILLDESIRLGIEMTFATVGMAAEEVPSPFAASELLAEAHGAGHEIASHSWRHEWLPHLTTQQLRRSLLRSKVALEAAIGRAGAVVGFVPPFNRPMTWLARGELHPGDRWAVPPGAGAVLDTLIPTVRRAGYSWIRASNGRRFGRASGDALWSPEIVGGIVNVPHHHNGFDTRAVDLVDQAVERRRLVVLSGHPAGLFRHDDERRTAVTSLLEHAARRRDAGELRILPVAAAVGVSGASA